MANDLTIQGDVVVTTEKAEASFDRVGDKAEKMAADVAKSATTASTAVDGIGGQAEKSAEKFTRAEARMRDAIKKSTQELQTLGKTASEKMEFNIEAKGLDASKLAPYIAELKKAEEAQRIASGSLDKMGMSAAATTAALRNVPAQFTDIIVSLQGGQQPMTVLLQQGGQLKDMFGGVGAAAKALSGYVLGLVNPFTLAAAGVAAIAVAYNQGSKENDAFVKSIALTGNASGVTTSQLRDYAREIDNVVGTQSKAAEGLAAFTAAGIRGGDQLKQFTQTAIEWEKATGQAVAETAKQFADLQKDPLNAVVKLNDGMNFLTASVYDQIKALNDQGRSAEASELAMNSLDAAMRERGKAIKDNLGYIERGWNGIKSAAKEAWDAMLNVGREASLNDRLGSVRKELNSLMDQQSWGETGGGAATGRVTAETKKRIQERIEALRAEEWQLEATAAAELMGASAREQSAKATQDAIAFSKTYDQYKSKEVQKTQELTKAENEYKARIQDATLTKEERNRVDKEYETIVAGINDKFKEKGGSGRTKAISDENKEFERQRKLIGELAGLSSTFYKDWDDLSKAFKTGVIKNVQDLEAAQSSLLAKQPFMTAAAKAEAAATAEKVKAYEAEQKAQEAILVARQKAAQTVGANVEKIKDEIQASRMAYAQNISMAKAVEMVALARAEDLYQKKLSEGSDAATLLALQQEIDKRKELIGLLGEKETFDHFKQAAQDATNDAKRMMDGVGDALSNALMDGGKSGADYLKGLLRTLFIKPFVMNIVANVVGNGGWIDSLLGMVGLGGGKGGASSIFGMASNANTAYNIYSGQGVAGQAWNWGKGVLGYGGTVPWSAAGAQASGAVTYPVGGSVGAAAPGQGGWMSGGAEWLASGGWVMAVPMIAAYLGGMFKEEKMVGTGLTGELGGDMYGYQLMRESGSWFDGPDYRYVVAEKRIKESKEEIERLKKEIAAAPEGENVSGKQVRMQRLYAEIERLEELYNGAIEGSKGPIKILQDAYAGMREDTASRADTLGLDGDAIRKMKVALGLDEIHPDTGGMGIELTGLSQEEASKKIQQALEQANEEMARSVLGTWETVTHDVTRTIFENVWVTDESDAGGHWQRTAKEVTESLTEQVFVMSEYVREGETAVQALTRLSDSLVGVNSVFDLLGATLLEGSLASADWASSLIEAVGSMDALAEATSTYFDLYYSDDEKRDRAVKNANKGMEDKGFDLRTNDADAKRKYRDLVDKAIADKDEELLAWLLKFADDFSNGVDAVNAAIEAKTAELQQVRDKTMGALGLSVDGLVDGFIQEINEGRGATAGTWLADQIVGGFEQAIYEQAITSIINSMIDGMITPMLTAALTGASISEIVSQAAIDQMIASASAAVEVLNTLLNSEDFQKGMEKLKGTIAGIGNTAGRAIPAMRSYQKQMASTGWAAGSDGVIYNAAEKAAEEAFQGIFDAAKTALDGAVGREKEYWQKFVDNAQESLDKAASYFDLVTDAAKGLRDSLDDVSTMQAAAGMVFIENALNQARQGKGLSDYDKTQEAVSAATGAMVMDNFASQAELDFEKKRLAGQLDELGVFADKQKTDAERLIEQGNAEIDRLDKLLEYWQNYGQASVDATLSVADAVKELEKQASSALGQKMLGVTYDGNGSLASFDVGTNYVPSDMTARIHRGERIIPAADNRALMAALQSPGSSNAELVVELRAVKAELAEIKQHTAGTQEYSRRTSEDLRQVTEGGNAMRTVAM